MNIGVAIKELRKQKGLTQDMLAERIGIAKVSLSNIERGEVTPAQKTLERICEVLEIPEPLIYIQAMEESDVPVHKRELYRQLFPVIKSMVSQISIG